MNARAAQLATVVALALVLCPVALAPPGYRYYGITSGLHPRRITLERAQLRSLAAQVAVWYGANEGSTWVQAGIGIARGERQPQAYIEVGHDGSQTYLETWPWSFGHPVTVSVLVAHGRYRVRIANWQSAAIPLDGATVDSMLETIGDAHASVVIDGVRVVG